MDEEAIQKSSMNNRTYAFTQLFNSHPLATNQTKENMGILGKLILQSEEELGKPKGKSVTPECNTPRLGPGQRKFDEGEAEEKERMGRNEKERN
jgi:hypothetical protein